MENKYIYNPLLEKEINDSFKEINSNPIDIIKFTKTSFMFRLGWYLSYKEIKARRASQEAPQEVLAA